MPALPDSVQLVGWSRINSQWETYWVSLDGYYFTPSSPSDRDVINECEVTETACQQPS